MIDPERIFRRYQDLQSYVGWNDEDVDRVHGIAPLLKPHLPALVEDFYSEIAKHPEARKVFTGDPRQIERLKKALLAWLVDLLTGSYDRDYVTRRWKVGAKHVEIGLDQVYTNAALSRLRDGLMRCLDESWPGNRAGPMAAARSLNKLLDLDLAKIEDAYQAENAARLQASERLATLGQVAAGIAHELRNPLGVIKSSLYYLRTACSLSPEKRAEHMRRIERNADRAERVITTLTNFARMSMPEPRAALLRPCLEVALGDLAIPDGIEVAIDCPADLPPVMVDPEHLRIVLENLVRNACEAMPSRGRLTLRGRRNGSIVDVSVVDTGVGIPEGDLGRILEPLYSTKPRGLGLGLSLARIILDKNGGTLHVTSEPGKGSIFTFRLIAAPEEEVEESAL